MASIHDKARSCFVFPDGDGGFVIRMTGDGGHIVEFILDLRQASRLNGELALALKELAYRETRAEVS